jgi:hypothetical protein
MCDETSERLQQLLMGAWSTGCYPAQNASYDHDGQILVVCATEFCARCSNTCVAFPLCAGACSYPLGVDEWLLSSAAFATTARVKSTSELDDNETCMCNIVIGVRYCCSQLCCCALCCWCWCFGTIFGIYGATTLWLLLLASLPWRVSSCACMLPCLYRGLDSLAVSLFGRAGSGCFGRWRAGTSPCSVSVVVCVRPIPPLIVAQCLLYRRPCGSQQRQAIALACIRACDIVVPICFLTIRRAGTHHHGSWIAWDDGTLSKRFYFCSGCFLTSG